MGLLGILRSRFMCEMGGCLVGKGLIRLGIVMRLRWFLLFGVGLLRIFSLCCKRSRSFVFWGCKLFIESCFSIPILAYYSLIFSILSPKCCYPLLLISIHLFPFLINLISYYLYLHSLHYFLSFSATLCLRFLLSHAQTNSI